MRPTPESTDLGNILERLSEIIMDTLKGISVERRPLDAATLSQALIKRQDLHSLISAQEKSGATAMAQVGDEGAEAKVELAKVREDGRKLIIQKDRLIKQMSDLEVEKSRIEAFAKRSLLTMITLADASAGDAGRDSGLSVSLEQFRNLVLRGADVESLEEALGRVKEDAFREDGGENALEGGHRGTLTGGMASASGFSFWKNLLGKRNVPDAAVYSPIANASNPFRHLQDTYLGILATLPQGLHGTSQQRLEGLQESVRACEDTIPLVGLKNEILDFVQDTMRQVLEERRQITHFMTEIGQNLSQMENHLLASLFHSRGSQQATSDLNRMIDGQMDDIRETMDLEHTLASLKELLVAKIKTIKEAIDVKRETDEKRMEEMNRELGALQENIQSMKEEVARAREKSHCMEREALRDALTGIPNRRAYERRIQEETQRFLRYEQGFSLLIFDLDEFKGINDRYGHLAGDRVLQETVRRINTVLRKSDFLARLGGDEFVVLLPGTGKEAARMVAEKLCSAIRNTRFLYQGQAISLSLSIGGTEVAAGEENPETIYTRTDNALYEAKRQGRNRAVIA